MGYQPKQPAITSVLLGLMTAFSFTQANAAPFTLAEVSVIADHALPTVSDSNHVTQSMNGDNAATTWLLRSDATADVDFGTSSTALDLQRSALVEYPGTGLAPGDEYWLMNVSTSLQFRSASDPTWVTLLESTLSTVESTTYQDVINRQFDFISGAPYEFRSLLSLDAGDGSTHATATSTWTDSLTFFQSSFGNPGSISIALSINAALLCEELLANQLGPWTGDVRVDHNHADVSTAFSLGVGENVRVQSESGEEYPTHVPEPSTLILTALALCPLVIRRRFQLEV